MLLTFVAFEVSKPETSRPWMVEQFWNMALRFVTFDVLNPETSRLVRLLQL